VLPETLDVLGALRRMQPEHQQMAIVVNEYDATEGLVTLEDLMEELVGEIYDETDSEVRAVQREPDGAFVLAGTFPVHDLVDLGVDLPEGDYATMAGLVLDRLGHVPRPPARPSTSMDGGSRSLRSPDAPSPECGYNPAPTPLTHRHHPDELHRPNAGSKRRQSDVRSE
jgi:hypothetical protein